MGFGYRQEQEISCLLHVIPPRLLSSGTVGLFASCKSAGAPSVTSHHHLCLVLSVFHPENRAFHYLCLCLFSHDHFDDPSGWLPLKEKSYVIFVLFILAVYKTHNSTVYVTVLTWAAIVQKWSCGGCTSTLYICTACCAFAFSLRMRQSTSCVWASCEVEFTFVAD